MILLFTTISHDHNDLQIYAYQRCVALLQFTGLVVIVERW